MWTPSAIIALPDLCPPTYSSERPQGDGTAHVKPISAISAYCKNREYRLNYSKPHSKFSIHISGTKTTLVYLTLSKQFFEY